ncbi:MAG: hypothetical protein IJP70_11570 [Bacteroidales bacterium]|nr:hypothetical protein [Bacteroidales bacterium]
MISKQSTSFLKKLLPFVLGAAFVALAWFRLVVQNSEVLIEAQDQSFWQPGSQYYEQMMQEPGGWFSWAGQYLTQYFYIPALGASLLIVLWLAIAALWIWGGRLPWYLCWIGFMPGLLLLWAETSLGYWIYVSKIPDWWFAPTLFVLAVSVAMALARGLNRWIRIPWQIGCLGFLIFMGNSWLDKAQVPATLQTPFHAMTDDPNYLAELRMGQAAEAGKWQVVLAEMRQAKQKPTRAMWMLKNMALLHEGRLATSWLDYPCITQLPVANDSVNVTLVETQGPLIYYLQGCIGFAYRWSMENMVEYGPSMKRLRLMIRCAFIKGEYDLARKYLTMLQRTRFHKAWADEQKKYLSDPSRLSDDPYYRIPMQLSAAHEDILDGDNSRMESYLHATASGSNSLDDPLLSELCLVYVMQTQNINTFWPQFQKYAQLHQGQPMPQLIQQAVLLYQNLEPQSAPNQQFPFDEEVVQLNQQFHQRANQLGQRGIAQENLGEALKREFGKTFFWFYFFCRDLSTY